MWHMCVRLECCTRTKQALSDCPLSHLRCYSPSSFFSYAVGTDILEGADELTGCFSNGNAQFHKVSISKGIGRCYRL
jgi:hypothetical protein